MTDKKGFRAQLARELLTQIKKTMPGVKQADLWKVGLIAAAIGCVIMQVEMFGAGLRWYGGAIFLCGILVSLLTFERN